MRSITMLVAGSRKGGFSPAMAVEDALRFAERVERSCSQALGEGLAGVLLHGSLTLGDYLPGRSDVDLLAVVEKPVSDVQLDALAAAVVKEWRRERVPVDVRVVTREVASAPTPAPAMELEVAVHPDSGLDVRKRHPGERDLVVEFSMCRAHGRSLVGPEPSRLIGEVPDEWVLGVGLDQLADWQAREYSPPHAELMVLTACRVWRFCEERRHCSKSAAGEWALRRDPTLRAARDALHRRRVDPVFPIEEGPVRELLAAIRTRADQATVEPCRQRR
jgi:predicted nucleotidyltransferase